MKKQRGFTLFELVVAIVVVAGMAGWMMNIVKLLGFDGALSGAGVMEVMRVVGIFIAPLGAVLGYL